MSLKICPWTYVPKKGILLQDGKEPRVDELLRVAALRRRDIWGEHFYSVHLLVRPPLSKCWNSLTLNYAVSFYKQWPKDKQLDIHDVREALVLCGKPARPVSFIQANILLAQIFGWTCHHSMIIYDNLTFNHCDHKKDDFHDNNNDHHPRSKTLTLLPLWQDSPMSAFMGGLTGEGQHDHHIHQHCHS